MVARVRVSGGLRGGVVYHTGLFGQLMIELQSSDHPRAVASAPRLDIVPARLERLAEDGQT